MNELFMIMGIGAGVGGGLVIAMWVAGLMGFLTDAYKDWHDGREIAQLVAEKNHKRRAELLGKMIELQRAMQPASSLIENPGELVNESVGCSDSGEKSCAPSTYMI
jgi:hypothetical protein